MVKVKAPPTSRRILVKLLLVKMVKRMKSPPVFHPFKPGPKIVRMPLRFQPSMVKRIVKRIPVFMVKVEKRLVKVLKSHPHHPRKTSSMRAYLTASML